MESSNQGTKRWDKLKTINPRERNNKEDNRQDKNKEISRNFEEKIHQKKSPSHRVIKKPTRRRNIGVFSSDLFSLFL